MFKRLIPIILFSQTCSKHITVVQNSTLLDCLGVIPKLIPQSYGFDDLNEISFQTTSLLSGISLLSDFISHYHKLRVIVLKENATKDYKLVFKPYNYDERMLLIQKERSPHFDPEMFLVQGWITRRARIGILQIQNNDFKVITNLNLDSTKVCSRYFYESYDSCCTNLTVTKHYPSEVNFKKMCKVRVAWIRIYPFVHNVTASANPGLMVSFLKLYEKIRNIKVVFQKNNSVYQEEFLCNGTFHQLRKDLLKGRHDIAIGLFFMNSTEDAPFSFGSVFFRDYYYIAMKRRERITNYQKFIIVFSPDVWKCCLVTFLLLTLLYFFLNLAVEPHRLGFVTAFFNVVRLTLSYTLPVLPRRISLRLLFIIYSFSFMIIDSAYLGTLSSIFTNAPYDVKVDEAKTVLEMGIPFSIGWLAERQAKLVFVVRNFFPKFASLGHMISNSSDEDLFKRVAHTQQNASFLLLSTIVSFPYEASLIDTFPAVNVGLSLFVTFYIRNDFHLKNSLQYWCQEMIERGLVSKWMNDIIEQNRNGSHIIRESKEAIPLKFQHFKEMFLLLLFGYIIASIALILEQVSAWVEQRFTVTKKLNFVISLLKPPTKYKWVY